MKLPLAALLVVAAAGPLAVGATPAAAVAASAPTLTSYEHRTSGLIPVAPGTQVRATVTCPRGTHVVGGGALLEGNSTAQGLNTSNPDFDGRTWVVRVNNSDESAYAQFRTYAICVAGVRHYQRIEGIGVDNPGGTQATAQALCPAGTVALGGGVNNTSGQVTTYVNSSVPLSRGWRVTSSNSNPDDDNFVQPYAVCGQRPAGWQQVTGTPSTIKSGVQGQAAAGCPDASKVLSGGARSRSTSQSVGQNSSAPSGSRVWQVFENNLTTAPSALIPYAVCATIGAG